MKRDVDDVVSGALGAVGGLPLAGQLHRGAVELERLPAHGRLPVLRRAEAHRRVGAVHRVQEIVESRRKVEVISSQQGAEDAAEEGERVRAAGGRRRG